MTDQLAIINQVISEHHSIRSHIRLVGDSLNDIEALFSLQKAHASWAQASIQDLLSKKQQLQQVLSLIDEGLRNHFTYEEKFLSSLFGEALTKALKFEHHEIVKQIEKARKIVDETNLERISQKDKLSSKSRLQQVISNVCQSIEQHANLEEQILGMLRKSLKS
jgi:hemerythrin